MAEDEARRKMQELKLKEEGIKDEEKQRAEADRETAADRLIFLSKPNREILQIFSPTFILRVYSSVKKLGGRRQRRIFSAPLAV